MRDKATIVGQIEAVVSKEVHELEEQIDARLDCLSLPCPVHIGKVSEAALEAINTMYTQKGKWTIDVFADDNDSITLTFS
jgi:hypothetical protein